MTSTLVSKARQGSPDTHGVAVSATLVPVTHPSPNPAHGPKVARQPKQDAAAEPAGSPEIVSTVHRRAKIVSIFIIHRRLQLARPDVGAEFRGGQDEPSYCPLFPFATSSS